MNGKTSSTTEKSKVSVKNPKVSVKSPKVAVKRPGASKRTACKAGPCGDKAIETARAATEASMHAAWQELRSGNSVDAIRCDFLANLLYCQGKFPAVATLNDHYLALAHTVRDRLLHRWINTAETYFEKRSRTVAYLSAEFLLGPHLGNNIVNLGIEKEVSGAIDDLGLDLHALLEQEEEPGLGNGGLGRLAACYMDSLSTLEIPAIGYGIRYEFGIFDQEIRDGWQKEITDKWLRYGNPWELMRADISYEVKLGGRTESVSGPEGRLSVKWIPERVVKGVPYDTPILGYGVNTANMLRLWKAEAAESFDFAAFNAGDYYGAVDEKVVSENITKVLYPNDEPAAGKMLRLAQQYFFVSCSLQDMLRLHFQRGRDPLGFSRKYAIQLNDTHPAIAVAELMRLLMDDHQIGWDEAWEVTTHTFAYTNHTLLPEALEKWQVSLMASLLPRHLEIIYEINSRFLGEVRGRFGDDEARISRMSLIDESGERYVRMAHLACVGSFAINGVAQLHTDLLASQVLSDFYEMWPHKFSNKTNGVTPRRFVRLANPGLSSLITSKIGEGWVRDLSKLKNLEKFAGDKGFRQEWTKVKRANKAALAGIIADRTGVVVDPAALFDIQAKRIHEYKRQHLNALNIVAQYLKIKRDPSIDVVPRVFIFGGKAAPGYFMAKLIIKLINSIGDVVNSDPDVAGRLKVVYLPDFNVKNAQPVYPAADLSEQISTAGKEASGTGNMKFSMNGALTIGTLDGANIEIMEEVGEENFFLFGLTAAEVSEWKAGGYTPSGIYGSNAMLREVIDTIASGHFSHGDRDLFSPIIDSLLNEDPFMVLADFQAYFDCQARVDDAFRDVDGWAYKSILNTARMGKFSSDRSIAEYCRDIWKIEPVKVKLKSLHCPIGR